jgi:hypothetical protein
MSSTPQYLYLLEEDLYRLGNSTSPKLNNVRPQDVDTYENNGILMVMANGKGVSFVRPCRSSRPRQPRPFLFVSGFFYDYG